MKIDTLVTMNKMEKVNTVHEVTPSGKQMFSKKKFQKVHNSLQHEALRAKVCFFGKVPLHLDPHQTWKKTSRRAVVWIRRHSHCRLFHFLCNNSRRFMSDIEKPPSSFVSPEMYFATVQTLRNG